MRAQWEKELQQAEKKRLAWLGRKPPRQRGESEEPIVDTFEPLAVQLSKLAFVS
jgi:hypothetical protein